MAPPAPCRLTLQPVLQVRLEPLGGLQLGRGSFLTTLLEGPASKLGHASARDPANAREFGVTARPAGRQEPHGQPGALGRSERAPMPDVGLDGSCHEFALVEAGVEHDRRDELPATKLMSAQAVVTVDKTVVGGHRDRGQLVDDLDHGSGMRAVQRSQPRLHGRDGVDGKQDGFAMR